MNTNSGIGQRVSTVRANQSSVRYYANNAIRIITATRVYTRKSADDLIEQLLLALGSAIQLRRELES